MAYDEIRVCVGAYLGEKLARQHVSNDVSPMDIGGLDCHCELNEDFSVMRQ